MIDDFAFFLTGALAFVINIAIIVVVSRWVMFFWESRILAILAPCVASAVASISVDFSITHVVAEYDRSFSAVVSRAAMAVVFALVVAFFVSRRAVKLSELEEMPAKEMK